MTIEIRELIIQVQVTEAGPSMGQLPAAGHTEWDEQRLFERLKQDVLDYLLERGCL